jgi:hypothetical protein
MALRPPRTPTTTARLRGGTADGHVVDLAVGPLGPSPRILAAVFEGAAIAIDQLSLDEIAGQQDLLATQGWSRYQRLARIRDRDDLEYLCVDDATSPHP